MTSLFVRRSHWSRVTRATNWAFFILLVIAGSIALLVIFGDIPARMAYVCLIESALFAIASAAAYYFTNFVGIRLNASQIRTISYVTIRVFAVSFAFIAVGVLYLRLS